MKEHFTSILSTLLQPKRVESAFFIFDPTLQFDEKRTDKAGIASSLNAAFLIGLAGDKHPELPRALQFLARMRDSSEWKQVATFYLNGIRLVHEEIERVCTHDPDFSHRLTTLFQWISDNKNISKTQERLEKVWSVFFPEATDILTNKVKRIKALRAKRTVTITKLNPKPITDPAQQILFTSNVLLTIPSQSESLHDLSLSRKLKKRLYRIFNEPQIFTYDHPIQVGIDPEKTEVLYGLRGLEEAFEYERNRSTMSSDAKSVCVLSVSVTHRGLRNIAKAYLEELFSHSKGLKNVDVYVFTEIDTQHIVNEILAPAAMHYLSCKDAKKILRVFGVDGEYGRHYSFLKAVSAFWSIFIQPRITATFKIDLDQVFPQKELVEQTGNSAFEHLKTPLWGSHCLDSNGQPLELGLIAGSLVNRQDIKKSLFTPDVPFPKPVLSPDEYFFFSTLPQALSTEAEMMTRYTTNKLDGKKTCIQRIHVTGGTNGILINSLRRYRPFTPSFIGRAEDQAYILPMLVNQETKLGYAHKDGLIMRHDKEVTFQKGIQSAYIQKIIGDYVRILYFSNYAKVLTKDVATLKDAIDPFTGCFISKIPASITYLRFGLKAASFFASEEDNHGLEFIKIGANRITEALNFVGGENSSLKQLYEKEHLGWNLYYDTLSAVEDGIKNNDSFALDLRKKAETIIHQCYVQFG